MNKEVFLKRCKDIHNDKYEYLIDSDVKTRDKIDIVCPKHGLFNQKVYSHLSGSGCKKCHNENNKLSNGVEKFIEKSKEVHGDRYDYSKVKYINNNTPVKIICREHGEFEQIPRIHIFKNSGCSKCSRLSKNNIIDKSKLKHNDKYDYSDFVYDDDTMSVNSNMIVKCPIHGNFSQRIKNHLLGIGCPYCRESKGERDIEKILMDNGLKRNVDYYREYKFKDCKNIHPLPFDFYLPSYSLCIEYDGEQHDKIVKFFGGFDSYEKRKINDKIKNQFCMDNNITLIRFNYKDKNDYILSSIVKVLN